MPYRELTYPHRFSSFFSHNSVINTYKNHLPQIWCLECMIFCEERCHITRPSSNFNALSKCHEKFTLLRFFEYLLMRTFSTNTTDTFSLTTNKKWDSKDFIEILWFFSNWFILKRRKSPPAKNFRKLCTSTPLLIFPRKYRRPEEKAFRLRSTLPVLRLLTYHLWWDYRKNIRKCIKTTEMFRHSPELYAVWNAKLFFLDSGLQRQGKVYDYAFWTDAGSLRENYAFKDWPEAHRGEHL